MLLRKPLIVLAVVGALVFSGCSKSSPASVTEPQAARVERVSGSDFGRVILSPRAAQRLGIETAPMRAGPPVGKLPRGRVMPYAALLYGANGDTFAYTSPAPLTYIRSRVTVDRIDGDVVLLSDGPEPGIAVVTVGAAELLGTEYGVGAS
jgi:hypothetical protein